MEQQRKRTTLDITEAHPALMNGALVEVRRRFDDEWARGFEVAASGPAGYRLRRRSDGAILPVDFPESDLRAASTS
jgi:hypothetical protein